MNKLLKLSHPLSLLNFIEDHPKASINDIQKIIDNGGDINETDIEGNTVLMKSLKNYNVAKLLISKGADVDAVNHHRTPAILMALLNNLPITYDLIKKTKNINQMSYSRQQINDIFPERYLLLSAIRHTPEYVEELLKSGADPNKYTFQPALTYALQFNEECVPLLLQYGASMTFNHDVSYPLFVAINDNSKYLKEILHKTPDINVVHRDLTAFHCAAFNNPEVLPLLIRHGVKIDKPYLEKTLLDFPNNPEKKENLLRSLEIVNTLEEKQELSVKNNQKAKVRKL